MIDIDDHRRELAKLLQPLPAARGNIFGAWCCIALAANSEALSFLESQAGEKEAVQSAMAELDRAWTGTDARTTPLHALQRIDWDPDDIEMKDEASAQAATDLLAAINHYLRWQTGREVVALIACAECVVNAVDYLVSFELIDAATSDPVLHELKAQRAFARELAAATPRGGDRLKYREQLVR